MTPLLPKAVLVALAICNQHISGWGTGYEWVDPKQPDIVKPTLSVTLGDELGPAEWATGYEDCAKIEAKAVAIVTAYQEKEWKAAEAVRKAKERAAAKKDRPALTAALRALGGK